MTLSPFPLTDLRPLKLQIASMEKHNKMNVKSLAIVFGPNMVWCHSQLSLTMIGQANNFVELLLNNYDQLFTL